MELVFLLVGCFLGGIIMMIYYNHHIGFIDIDKNTKQYRIRISSEELENEKIKHILLNIDHNIYLPFNDDSRDELFL